MPSPSSRSSSPLAPAAKTSAATHSARSREVAIATQANALGVLLALMLLPGCYYSHLAEGQLRLLRAREPIAAVLDDASTPASVRDSLALVGALRRFAAEIGLDVDDQYQSYAPWPGDRVVTALVATRSGEIDPAGFWFPLLGTQPYKGYFDLARAERDADSLRDEGLDTCLVPVPAYSTLGWFDDPVVEPMLQDGPGSFVEMLLHELVHATVFVTSDADFNEGVATFVGQEAGVAFFAERGDAAGAERQRAAVRDERAVAAVLASLRAQIAALYAEPDDGSRSQRREQLAVEARASLRALPLTTRSATALADAIPLQDACLALAATYDGDLPVWARRLEELGDLPAFVAAAKAAAATDDPRATLSAASGQPAAR